MLCFYHKYKLRSGLEAVKVHSLQSLALLSEKCLKFFTLAIAVGLMRLCLEERFYGPLPISLLMGQLRNSTGSLGRCRTMSAALGTQYLGVVVHRRIPSPASSTLSWSCARQRRRLTETFGGLYMGGGGFGGLQY